MEATLAAAIDLSWMAAVLLAAVGTLAVILRRRLPRGLPEGVFTTAVTGAVVQIGGTLFAEAGGTPPRVPVLLAALCAIWYGAARAFEGVAGRPAQAGEAGPPEPSSTSVWFQAATVCGLLAAAGVLDQELGSVWPVPAILLAVVLPGSVRRRWPEVLAGLALLVWLVARSISWPRYDGSEWLALLLGTLALLLVLLLVVLDWYLRSRAWHGHPYRAPPPTPRRTVGHAAALALSAAAGLAALPVLASWVTVFSGALSAYAAFGTAHRTGWAAAGWLGLLLVVQAVAALAWVCLVFDRSSAISGLVLPGALLIWLALFWRQQLHNGQAWTTAGRLIAPASRLAAALTAGAFVLVAAGFAPLGGMLGSGGVVVTAGGPVSGIVILFLLPLAGLWLRARRETGEARAEFLVCLAAASLGLVAGEVPNLLPASVRSPMTGLAAVGLLLGLGVWLLPGRIALGEAGLAYVGGVLPTLALAEICRRGVESATLVALLLAAAGAAASLLAQRGAARGSTRRED
jgi:hypothetical protein